MVNSLKNLTDKELNALQDEDAGPGEIKEKEEDELGRTETPPFGEIEKKRLSIKKDADKKGNNSRMNLKTKLRNMKLKVK